MDEDEIVNQYLNRKISSKQICIEFGLTPYKLRSLVIRKGHKLFTKGSKRTYKLDESYFSSIDSESKAYWLGFIYAEGNLFLNTLKIKLHNKDKERLDLFKSDIKSTASVKPVRNKDAHVFSVNSKKIKIDLNKLGVFPNKSAIITMPNIPSELIHHFIRGFFDGDGCITVSMKKASASFSSCSRVFLEGVLRAIGINGSICERKRKLRCKRSYQLQYSCLTSVLVGEYLYREATIFLKRKWDKFVALKVRNAATKRNKISKYKGVCPANWGSKWKAYVQFNKKKLILGHFDTEIEAAREYVKFCIEHGISCEMIPQQKSAENEF